jgi:hypothetical protein
MAPWLDALRYKRAVLVKVGVAIKRFSEFLWN